MGRFIFGSVLLSFVFSFSVNATVSFENDREGSSYYNTKSNNREITRAHKIISKNKIQNIFETILNNETPQKLCSFDLVEKFEKELLKTAPKFKEFEGVIYSLRENDLIDDSVVRLLLEAREIRNRKLNLPKDSESLTLPSEAYTLELIPIIAKFNKSLCLEESYKNLYNEIKKVYSGLNSKHLEALFVKAFQEKKIDFKTYEILERSRLGELETKRLSLSSYYKKIQSLRIQYPVVDTTERSNFVTGKAQKQKISYRTRLLENYSEIQIIIMGNVIKKLRSRLESPRAEIIIYDREDDFETVILGPMERFRLAVKLLRKEMAELKLNTFFDGRSPDYLDLISASFEIGVIAGEEVDEMATLQEFWNPKKTFWEKAKVWVQVLSSTATIVIPPPFGFIPALAVVVIEATVTPSANPNEVDPTSLF